ncbi:hypothetical protein [Aeromonas hydrophila]|uniref:hypothetical protein n=1 Tax=Aeromonas hydrophila TaxID=644 RepID=UPI002B48BFC5|nr:hypothetical protein [Aeromonas hydrophila]
MSALQAATTDEVTLTREEILEAHIAALLEVARGYQGWIMAVPDEVAAALPAMPGIDGDWAESVMADAKTAIRSKK